MGTLAGFFASWQNTTGSMDGFGAIRLEYRLRDVTAIAGSQSSAESYSDPDSDASNLLKQTFDYQFLFVVGATVLGLAALGLLVAWGFATSLWASRAALATLALFALTSGVGAAIFAHNFPVTEEGRNAETSEASTFWGSQGGFDWAPGFAWYAEVASSALAVVAFVLAAVSVRARSSASASTALP